jgi:hypothetical protein
MQALMPFLLVGAGAFSIAGAAKDWDFFMNNRRARLIVAILGREGARVFYGLLGSAFVVGGLVLLAKGAR